VTVTVAVSWCNVPIEHLLVLANNEAKFAEGVGPGWGFHFASLMVLESLQTFHVYRPWHLSGYLDLAL
jgi:hypothetical protein